MGLIVGEVTFANGAPSLTCIVDNITELSGLSLLIENYESDTHSDFYDLYVRLSFSSTPGNQLTLYAYRNGAVREIYEDCADFPISTVEPGLQGLNEPANAQVVYLNIYIGQEPTLFYIALFALEALGGSLKCPVSEAVRHQYLKRLTHAQLRRRSLQSSVQALLVLLIGVVLLPLLIPLWGLQFLCCWIKLPKIIRKVERDWNNRGGAA